MVLVLLFASVERFSVSRMRDFFIKSPQRHLAAISAGGRLHRRPVDWASNSCNKSLILNTRTFYVFFLNLWPQLFLTILTADFCTKKTFEIYKTNITSTYKRLTFNVIKTKLKDWTILTIEVWSQILDRMAGLGLGIRQRLLTIS